MQFINRMTELACLDRLMTVRKGGLAVVYGRRRIGKTRLLLEWTRKHNGLYAVADQSTPDIQRRYLSEAIAERFPGFADASYRDWTGLLTRLARESKAARWRGPVVLDELPYLVATSRELPSVLQRWIDHEARAANLVVAVAGSSQRMMQGLVLSAEAPLYGRASEIIELQPIGPAHLKQASGLSDPVACMAFYTAWGGVPRYWELAANVGRDVRSQIDQLVLDPLGPLHREPDRLLLEEMPTAMEARPILDAIGSGAHRISEIAGRIGRPATSMARPLDRLIGMGLVRREVPFAESEKKGRRSLYKIDDPFFRLWFRVVAPHRGILATATRAARLRLLEKFWSGLASDAWETLCRNQIPDLRPSSGLGCLGPWGPALRWWRGAKPEWDIVSESVEGDRLLLGEAKWSDRLVDRAMIDRALREIRSKPMPVLPASYSQHDVVRAIFVPGLKRGERLPKDLIVVSLADLVG